MGKSYISGELAQFRTKSIASEVEDALERKKDYRSYPIRQQCPDVGLDELIDLRSLSILGENYYHSCLNPPYHQSIHGASERNLVRRSIGTRLQEVNNNLKSYGLQLWVYDGWRPISVQNYFHDHWMPSRIQSRQPHLEGAELLAEVEKYWAKGALDGQIDPASPPPHATGAAIDLTLIDANGHPLFMGSIFDDVTKLANTAYFEAQDCSVSYSYEEARGNRRMLYWIMRKYGFSNNPTEWWHFSYGDQMWAKILGKPEALFTAVR